MEFIFNDGTDFRTVRHRCLSSKDMEPTRNPPTRLFFPDTEDTVAVLYHDTLSISDLPTYSSLPFESEIQSVISSA